MLKHLFSALAFVGALALGLAGPAPAHAQLTYRVPVLVGPPSPRAAYAPSGVLIGPFLEYGILGSSINGNGGTDTTHVVRSWWERGSVATSASTLRQSQAFWTKYLAPYIGNPAGSSGGNAETSPGTMWVYDNASSTFGTLRNNLNDATGGTNHSFYGIYNNIAPQYNSGWHHYFMVADMGFAQGSKRAAVYVDGVKATPTSNGEVGTVGSFNINFNSPQGWAFNGHTGSGIHQGAFEIADYFEDIVTTSISGCTGFGDASNHLIDASSNACPVLLAKFIDANGKPVDIGSGSGCTLPTGRQPELCFSGDQGAGGTSGGFLTNQGNATGALALVNPLTNGLDTARTWTSSYGPAGPPSTQPYLKGCTAGGDATSLTNSATQMTGLGVVDNQGCAIALNDFLLLQVAVIDTSVALNRNIVCPTGWTSVFGNIQITGTRPANHQTCYKVAAAGDVTASGADMATPPTPTWTADGSTVPRSAGWQLTIWGNVNTTTPIQASASSSFSGTATTSFVAPSVTATSAPALLVSLYAVWGAGASIVPDSTEVLRRRRAATSGAGAAALLAADKVLNATGATSGSTATIGSGNSGVAQNLILQP